MTKYVFRRVQGDNIFALKEEFLKLIFYMNVML